MAKEKKTAGQEQAAMGIRNVGDGRNIAGIVVGHGAVILLDEKATGLYVDDLGECYAPQSELDRYLEDWPFAFEPLRAGESLEREKTKAEGKSAEPLAPEPSAEVEPQAMAAAGSPLVKNG